MPAQGRHSSLFSSPSNRLSCLVLEPLIRALCLAETHQERKKERKRYRGRLQAEGSPLFLCVCVCVEESRRWERLGIPTMGPRLHRGCRRLSRLRRTSLSLEVPPGLRTSSCRTSSSASSLTPHGVSHRHSISLWLSIFMNSLLVMLQSI